MPILTLVLVVMSVTDTAIIAVLALALVSIGISIALPFQLAQRALKEDPRDILIHKFAIALAASKGTSLKNANLTKTNFSQANLQSTDLRGATLSQTTWDHALKLSHARLDNTYLADEQIRQLVLTKQGQKQIFDGKNLTDINLKGANLSDASFIKTNFQQANLSEASLLRSVFTQAQLDKADLTNCHLTGAYIEDWTVTTRTKLDQIDCQYIYLHLPTREDPNPKRQPVNSDECFNPGDFAVFIRSWLVTARIKALPTTPDYEIQEIKDWLSLLQTTIEVEFGTDQKGKEKALKLLDNLVQATQCSDPDKDAIDIAILALKGLATTLSSGTKLLNVMENIRISLGLYFLRKSDASL